MNNRDNMTEQNTNKKEWKWPYGILLAYLIFVTATLGFVFFTFTVKTDLVADQYYEKTLVYQDQIDRERNALELTNPLQINLVEKYLAVEFPEGHKVGITEGSINLYRPSNSMLDEVITIEIDENGRQLIDMGSKQKGVWKVQVLWKHDNKEYFKESAIYLK